MRVRLETDGGLAYLPALAAPISVDTSTLPPEAATRLGELVASARIWSRPPESPSLVGADMQQHTLTIEDGGATRRLVVHEPLTDSSLHDLFEYLRSLASRKDTDHDH